MSISFIGKIFTLALFLVFPVLVRAGVITDAPRFGEVFVNVLQFLLSVVGILAIIMLVVSGMIYFFAAGDRKKMELAKKSTLYAIVGIIVALSASVVTRLIGGFFSN